MKAIIIIAIALLLASPVYAGSKPTDMDTPLTNKEKNDIEKTLKEQRKLSDTAAGTIKGKLNKRGDVLTEMLKLHKLDIQTYRRGGKSAPSEPVKEKP